MLSPPKAQTHWFMDSYKCVALCCFSTLLHLYVWMLVGEGTAWWKIQTKPHSGKYCSRNVSGCFSSAALNARGWQGERDEFLLICWIMHYSDIVTRFLFLAQRREDFSLTQPVLMNFQPLIRAKLSKDHFRCFRLELICVCRTSWLKWMLLMPRLGTLHVCSRKPCEFDAEKHLNLNFILKGTDMSVNTLQNVAPQRLNIMSCWI